jgi:hypothetical protein
MIKLAPTISITQRCNYVQLYPKIDNQIENTTYNNYGIFLRLILHFR